MEKTKVKIYSETFDAPAYATAGASGFDLKVQLTDKKTCTLISLEDIKTIEKAVNYYDDELEVIYSKYFDSIQRNFIDYVGAYSTLIHAITNKLTEVNKNDNTRFNHFSEYLESKSRDEVNIILPFSHNIMATGYYVQIPEGYEIQIRPRSGIAAKTNMIMHWGTIDADYRGNCGIIINNPSPYAYIILPGERLAQGVFAKVHHLEWERVKNYEELEETDRGEGGFGSTGK